MTIVADHLHDREPLRRTLTRLDTEIVTKHTRARENSRVKSFLDQKTPVAFLDRLRNHVADFLRYFALDCVELTHVCSGLLKKLMTDEMRTLMKHARIEGEHYVALLIMAELDSVEQRTRPGTPVPTIKHAMEAAAFLKKYIQGGEDARAVIDDYMQR